ncbi:sulfotransferase family protein, partial [Salmonella sp. SAL04269]
PNAETVRRAREADFDAVARGYARRARWLSRGKPFFTEKLPQNFLNVGFIAKALPQARFLHLVRDPMDTCFSNLRQL